MGVDARASQQCGHCPRQRPVTTGSHAGQGDREHLAGESGDVGPLQGRRQPGDE